MTRHYELHTKTTLEVRTAPNERYVCQITNTLSVFTTSWKSSFFVLPLKSPSAKWNYLQGPNELLYVQLDFVGL